jgi:HSP20 family protein
VPSPVPQGFERLRDRLFDDLERWPDLIRQSARAAQPAAEVEDRGDAYVLAVEVPGIRPDDLTVEVAAGRLVVEGRRRRTERAGAEPGPSGRLRLVLTLPPDVDDGRLSAALDSGVLRVTLPRTPDAARRSIPVVRRSGAAPQP